MRCWIAWLAIAVVAVNLVVGCGGDQKDVNKNKEKPQPAAK